MVEDDDGLVDFTTHEYPKSLLLHVRRQSTPYGCRSPKRALEADELLQFVHTHYCYA